MHFININPLLFSLSIILFLLTNYNLIGIYCLIISDKKVSEILDSDCPTINHTKKVKVIPILKNLVAIMNSYKSCKDSKLFSGCKEGTLAFGTEKSALVTVTVLVKTILDPAKITSSLTPHHLFLNTTFF